MSVSTRYWVSTVSLEHVQTGVKGGFCQVCHGKKAPLAKMHEGDWIIYYSPKKSMESTKKCQQFTAIGKIADEKIYKFKMKDGFVPFRRKVEYVKDASRQDIRPLLDKLSFIRNKTHWGMQFRCGLFRIPKSDFQIIYKKMVGSEGE